MFCLLPFSFTEYFHHVFIYSNGTAIGGDEEDIRHHKCDYQHIKKGVVQFAPGETSKNISIKVDPTADVRTHFFATFGSLSKTLYLKNRCGPKPLVK